MGNYSRDTYKQTSSMYQLFTEEERPLTEEEKIKDPRNYTGVRLQQGVPLVDADWNELEDIRRYEQRAMLKWLVGDGVPQGSDGFFIKDAAQDNFTICKGVCYVNGWTVVNPADTKYTEQELYIDQDLADALGIARLPDIQLEPGLKYEVYLDVWEREIDEQYDSRIVNDAIGIETCLRIKQEWVVRVVEAGAETGTETGHWYYKLADITVTGTADTTVNYIADEQRCTGLAVLSSEGVKNAQLAENAVTSNKIAPNAVAYNNINFSKSEWILALKAGQEDNTTCFIDGPTRLEIQLGTSTIADNETPVIWAVYPLDTNWCVYNYFYKMQMTQPMSQSNMVLWYTWIDCLSDNIITPPRTLPGTIPGTIPGTLPGTIPSLNSFVTNSTVTKPIIIDRAVVDPTVVDPTADNPTVVTNPIKALRVHFRHSLSIINGYNNDINVKVVGWWLR